MVADVEFLDLGHAGEGDDIACCQAVAGGDDEADGFGVDGSKVRTIQVNLLVKAEQIAPGTQQGEQPCLLVHYYDAENRQVGIEGMGPWLGSFAWQRFKSSLRVPPQAQMAVLLIGLNGATGRMSIDDVSLKASSR